MFLQENFRTWQTQLIHSSLGNFPSIIYSNKLFLMENVINHQISKHLQVCTCQKSDSLTQRVCAFARVICIFSVEGD